MTYRIPPVRHGIPQEIETQVFSYPIMDGVSYERHSCTVWVDEGYDVLLPHRYEGWYRRVGQELWQGPLQGLDIPVFLMGPTGLMNAATFEGEVVDPEPMDVQDVDGDVVMEIEGADDVFVEQADGEPGSPGSEETDPEEFPLSEEDE